MGFVKRKTPARSYSGEKWTTNKTNKKYLVIDFMHRCAYCDDFDSYSGGYENYHVEHFAPKEKFPKLKYTYENLLYACPYCNRAKSDTWVSDDPMVNIKDDEGFIDPCKDEYNEHLERRKDGTIVAKTKIGIYMHKNLKLYLRRHSIIYNLELIEEKRNRLAEQINIGEMAGQDMSIKKSVLLEIDNEFFNYYNLLKQA